MSPEEIKEVAPNQAVDTSPPEEMTGITTQQEIDREQVRAGREQAENDERDEDFLDPEVGV